MRSEKSQRERNHNRQRLCCCCLPFTMDSLFIPLNIQNSRSKLNAWSLEKAFTAHRRVKRELYDDFTAHIMTLLWARKLVWNLMLAACARDVSEMCDEFPAGCHKHLSLRFFMASYRTLMVVCTTLHVSISSTHFSPSVHFFCVVIFSNISQRWKKSRDVSSHFHVKFSRLSHHMFKRIVCDQFSNVADVERASFLII